MMKSREIKVGDLVTLKNLHPDWGLVALVTKINVTPYGTGQIHVIANGLMDCTIPWNSREEYIVEASSESR